MLKSFAAWYSAQTRTSQALVIAVAMLLLGVVTLAIAGYREASHSRDLVLEQNKVLTKERDRYKSEASIAKDQAPQEAKQPKAQEAKLNETNKNLAAAQSELAGMQKTLADRRANYRRARVLTDRELDDLRANPR